MLLIAVVCCCLAPFGKRFSTTSAEISGRSHDVVAEASQGPIAPDLPHAALPAPPGRRRTAAKNARRNPRVRRRGEIAQERARKRAETEVEIDAIYAEYAFLASRDSAIALGAIYARYSTRHQDSIVDQVRAILWDALRLNIFVSRDMIFFDEGVRGVKSRRDGLQAVEAVLQRKLVGALLLFATSRLFRKQYRTLHFVDQIYRGFGIRCVFIKSGVDTDNKGQWEQLLAVQAMLDQFVVTVNIANIHAAHIGQLQHQIVFGTLSFGYCGEPIEGQFTRRGKPRCRIVINDDEAEYVRMIFGWYVNEGLTIEAIVQRLNDIPDVPLPPRSPLGEWTRDSVKGVIKNIRYRAMWRYGMMEAMYVPDADYVRQRPRTEALSEVQLEGLRIIPDDVWFAAQERLKREGLNRGRRAGQKSERLLPKVVNGMLFCGDHLEQILYAAGAYGRVMRCRRCQRSSVEQRYLFTHLNRQLAVERICAALVDLIRDDASLVDGIITACQAEAAARQKPDPAQQQKLRQELDQLENSIAFTLRNVGQTPNEQQQSQKILAELRNDQAKLAAQLHQIELQGRRPIVVPTVEEVRGLIAELDGILVSAASSTDPEQLQAVRHVIDCMTGGRIEIHQCGEKAARRGWLEGRCRVRLLPHLLNRLSGQQLECDDEGVEVKIDFRKSLPSMPNSDRAWGLFLNGKSQVDIAGEMHCSKANITKLIKQAAAARGIDKAGLRELRRELRRQRPGTAKYREIADRVIELWNSDEGLLIGEIAERVGYCHATVTMAIEHWHVSRGLPVPDGRTRRKSLCHKTRETSTRSKEL